MTTNKKANFDKLKELRESNKRMTHLYFRRLGGRFVGDIIDMPLHMGEWTINQYPNWELVESNEQMDEDISVLFDNDTNGAPLFDKDKTDVPPLEVPAVPDTISDKEFENIMSGDDKKDDTTDEKIITSTLPAGIATKPAEKHVENTSKKQTGPSNKEVKCDKCEFVAKNKNGLRLHSVKHNK